MCRILALATLVLASLNQASAEKTYALLVDAGSSGSRIGMYTMEGGHLQELKPAAADKDKFVTTPGLSFYLNEPEKAGASLESICQAALKYVPADQVEKTKMWVKATAGMRSLNQEKTMAIYASVERFLNSPKFPFKFASSQTMSGEEEAVFTYMTVNYLKGTIGHSPLETHGIIEMGGASLQVIFKPTQDILGNKFSYYINSNLQSVYATSFMYGTGMAQMYYRKTIIREHRKQIKRGLTTFKSPCFLIGHDETVEVDGKNYTFQGSSDPSECEKYVMKTLHTDYECGIEPCPLMGVHMTPFDPKQKLMAVSAFFFSVYELKMARWEDEVYVTIAEIRGNATAWCKKTRAEAEPLGPNPWKFQNMACLWSMFAVDLLGRFGIKNDSRQVLFTRKYDWKLGSMLYDLKYMPLHRVEINAATGVPEDEGENYVRLQPGIWVLLVVLLICWGACNFAVGRASATVSDKPTQEGADRMIQQGVDVA